MPSKGEIKYFYPDISIETSRDLFSTLLQDYKIFPLSIEENISMDAETKDITRLEAALRFAGLEDKVNQLPDGIHTVLTGEFLEGGVSFSGGEQQKLAIARTFTGKNPVLIFDEPSANLDPIAENEMIDKINHIAEGKAVIMVTHNPELAEQYSTRIIRLLDGEVVADTAPFNGIEEEKVVADTSSASQQSSDNEQVAVTDNSDLNEKDLLKAKAEDTSNDENN